MPNYDVDLVNKNLTCFKGMGYEPEEVTIYFDLDNTLCLFSPYGDVKTSFNSMYSKGFYRELYCFPEVPSVIENLKRIGFSVKILSSCINSEYCISEKKAWVNFHLPMLEDEDIILVPQNEFKIDFIRHPKSSLLVDDYYENILGMYSAGGVGIKKTFTGKKRVVPQIESLVDIFSILHSLRCL